ncbi:MAG: FKBP-type peptidyl-prolyl cis-trans isomerase [Paludibacteraceae bacterium]|nr:FKBP-type peptidyl-prolyl cis-trans isomerase [Paludibacteraceae bacterium]MED9995915.1 FKBP-type peptidyl-prolyl cis-trans isomerase [Paludibacteraceae bacterium]
MEKVSYALGLSIGNNLLSSGIRDLNVEKFTKAIQDVLGGVQPEMTYEEAKTTLDKFFKDLADKINAQNIQVGKEFLENNAKKEGVVCLPSGLQYQVLQVGTGKKPGATDKVRCHYHGMLLDGTVFDSSVNRGEPAEFGVNQVIQGWVEALQLMEEGAKWRLFIPSDMAYGARGAGQSIPPHATLIFDVELIKVL